MEKKAIMSAEEAWLLGLVIGDGHVSVYFVEISDRFKENLIFAKSVIEMLGFDAKITRDNRENRYRLWVNSRKFVEKLHRLGYASNMSVPKTIIDCEDSKIIHAFIRGLYDAEGYVENWRPRGMTRINFSNKSKEIIDFIAKVLRSLGIKPYLRYSSKAYRIQIYRKQDVHKYLQEVGFSYPSKLGKINPHRLPERKAET